VTATLRRKRRDTPWGLRTRRAVTLVMALASFFFACCCQAKDWDLDRAKYLTATQAMRLRGPVRSLTTYSYKDGSLAGSEKLEFDHEGNLVRSVDISSPSLCSESTYTYDPSGNLVSESRNSGQPKVGDVECHNQRPSIKRTYTYVFDERGVLTFRKSRATYPGLALDIPDTITSYSYDSAKRPSRIESFTGTTVSFHEYSYGSDPRGIVVRKRSYYNDRSVVFDVITELVYAADDRLLESTQSPPDVFGFGGREVDVYDKAGRLIQKRAAGATTNYGRQDKYGNWTISRVGAIREMRSFTYY